MSEGEASADALPDEAPDEAGSPAGDEVEPDVVDAPDGAGQVTGEPRVDRALARLRDVEGTPLSEHVGAYDEVHRLLHHALADLDGE